MNPKTVLLLVVVICAFAYAQGQPGKDTASIDAIIAESKGLVASDSAKAVTLAQQAKQMAAKIDYRRGEANALKYIGMVYYIKGHYAETLDYWNQSLDVFQGMHDDAGISNMFNNIGAIYLNQGADDKALEYILKSLQLAEKIGDTLRIATALSNVGGIYHNKRDPVALDYLLKAIPLLQNSSYVKEYIGLTGNIGEIYADRKQSAKALEYFQKSIKAADTSYSSAFSINGIARQYREQGNLPEALKYYNAALDNAKKFDENLPEVRSLQGIADVYIKKDDIQKALDYYKRAQAVAEGVEDLNVELKDLYKEMASAYSKTKDFSDAFLYQSLYSNIKDSLYTLDTKKKLNQLQFDFDLYKKEGELSRKEVEINLKEAKIKSDKQARIGMTLGLVLLLIIAIIIYRNYLQKAKTNKILDKQKVEIEGLLMNILPREVASELQASGKAQPRHFEEVSVLFTDFKGFTSIADKLSPQEVVEQLNECFIAFDGIMGKYNLEKIKTIGDAYMCAGNIPSPNPDHAYSIIRAAMEIRDFMERHNINRAQKGMEPWEIRIGIHIGPVVAGVVGQRKYAYDIWGSAVNIASRMESNGIPGRVNISAHTYHLVKHLFECSYRGKIYAKNLGELDMYLVERERSSKGVQIVPSDKKEVQHLDQPVRQS